MNRDHLTEERIQEFLDRNLILDDETAFHLNTCPKCRQALTDYKAVISGLSEEPEIQLSPDFVDAVIGKIPELNQIETKENSKFFIFQEKFIAAAFALIVISAAIYFINFEHIFSGLINSFSAPESNYGASFTWLENKLSEFGKLPLMVLFTAMTIGLIAGIDNFISHHRKQTGLRIFSV
ncbi:MAG: hypothetical protein V3V99_08175 [candidate division Zixibacteria bacterium]